MEFNESGNLVRFAGADGNVSIPLDKNALTDAFMIVLRVNRGEFHKVTPGETLPEIKHLTTDGGQVLVMEWPLVTRFGNLKVTGKVSLPENSQISYWSINIDNSTCAAIDEIHYPRISGLTGFPEPGPDWLAGPFLMGCKTPDPVAGINRGYVKEDNSAWAEEFGGFGSDGGNCIAYSYPGMWTMQYLAYGHPDSGGVYFGAHDSQALYKKFGIYADGNTGRHAALVMKQYPEDRLEPGRNFKSFFDGAIGVYRGEWWNASKLYRNWAVNQLWAEKGPLKSREDIPQWVLDTDFWYWNHLYDKGGHPKIIIPTLEYLKEYLDTDLSFHWYGYNGEQFDTFWRYPEMVPDNPDIREQLQTGVEKIHEMGIKCLPYINARLWNPDTKSFRDADGMRQISIDENGEPSHNWGYIGHTVCPTSKPFRELIISQVERFMDEFDMDGAYLDQLSGCYAVPCFNPDHGHGVGGHDHWIAGYRELMNILLNKTKSRNPDVAFSSESTIECYLDQLDTDLARELTNLELCAGGLQGMPVPMFISVYHDYHLTYGSVSKLLKAQPTVYRYAESLCFVAGQQLMVGGYFKGDEKRESVATCLKFMKTLVKARKQLHEFLSFGQWLPPVKITCETIDLDLSRDNPLLREIPAVISGCFRLKNQICIVLVNHSEKPRKGLLAHDLQETGIDTPVKQFSKIYPETESCEYHLKNNLLQTEFDLSPESVTAYIIELEK